MKTLLTPLTLIPKLPQSPGHFGEPFEIITLTPAYFTSRAGRQDQVVEMIWLTNGNFQVMNDMEKFEVSRRMILFQAPGQAFYVSSATDLEGFVIRFPAAVIPAEVNSSYPNLTYCVSRIFEVDATTAASITSVIQCMQCELTSSHSQKTEVLSGCLRIILIYLLRQRSIVYRSSHTADIVALAKRFFDLLERNYHINKKVKEYADELAITPNYLNQIIKQETGMTASANIRKRLLLQAKRMAMGQNVSMKMVAYKLGFEDTAHFSKFFKMGCGCNFTDYRKTQNQYLL